MGDLTGLTLGERYRVVSFLGRGGMADVYKVWDQQRTAVLAMKALHEDLALDRVFLRRFKREAMALERLQHPNIVRFYGLEEIDGQAFILMDFIDGMTLRKEIFLNRCGMRSERILAVLRPVCAALHFAHQMGIMHCDLKPANIMIHRSGAVYLTDFGISRMAETTTRTLPAAAGTPAYMAPELLEGGTPTPASDIYGLGVILFEMLTGGERPFTGEAALNEGNTAQKIAWEKRNLAPPSPRLHRPDISPELEQVVMRCLDRDPASRYDSALDLLLALEIAIKCEGDPAPAEDAQADLPDPAGLGETVTQPEQPPAEPVELPKRDAGPLNLLAGRMKPRGFWMILAAALAVALLAWGGQSLIAAQQLPGPDKAGMSVGGAATLSAPMPLPSATSTARRQSTPPAKTPESRQTPSPTAGQPAEGGRLAAAPEVNTPPSAAKTPLPAIAFASDRSGTVQIWVMDEEGRSRDQVTDAQGGACQPAWSPDGKRLAYITPCNGPRITYPNSKIEVIDLETREVTELPVPRSRFAPAWSPDGESIAYTAIINEKTEIRLLRLDDMQEQVLSQRGEKNLDPAFSPEGTHIVFISDDENGVDAVWRMRTDGGAQEALTEAGLLKNFSKPVYSPDGRWILATLRELNVMQNTPELVLIDRLDPRQESRRLMDESIRTEGGSFSPDGEWVVFHWMMEGGNLEVLRVNVETGELVRLTNTTARDFHPSWNPAAVTSETQASIRQH